MSEQGVAQKPKWSESLKAFLRPSVLRFFLLGFSAGVPILLIFSSLSLWLREAGVERSSVTQLSWAALGYSFKFIWAPLVDQLPLPWIGQLLGRRRSWLLLSQAMIIASIVWMAFIDPQQGSSALMAMAFAAVALGFSSATQDIVIDAFRIESDLPEFQALISSSYIAGYRLGMIVAGAGALFLASAFGSTLESYSYVAWRWTYLLMALTMILGVLTTLFSPEPEASPGSNSSQPVRENLQFFLSCLGAIALFVLGFWSLKPVSISLAEQLGPALGSGVAVFLSELFRWVSGGLSAALAFFGLVKLGFVQKEMVLRSYLRPVSDFFQRYGKSTAILLLALIGFYRVSDIVLGIISNVFYQDLGFTKNEIASVVKTFGLIMTLVGGFLGGLLTARFGVIKILFLGALLSASTNLLFMGLASRGDDLSWLYLVISADNLSAGLASAAFIAFLSSLTNVSFTAVQYAIFSSLMTLAPKLLGGYSGSMVDHFGYSNFFLVTAIMGLPVLGLIGLAGRKLR